MQLHAGVRGHSRKLEITITGNAYGHNQYLVTKDATMSNDLRLDLLKEAIAKSGMDIQTKDVLADDLKYAQDKAERKAEIQAMAALRERRQAAVAQILEQAAIVTNGLTKAQLVEARVQVLEAAATVTSKGGAKLSLVSAVAAKRQVGEIGEVEIGGRR
jgi:hypothetical protein